MAVLKHELRTLDAYGEVVAEFLEFLPVDTDVLDGDCEDGLSCYTLTEGKRCVPDGCDACFDQGKYCYWDENQQDGEHLTCDFRECG